MKFSTKAIHSGSEPDPTTGAIMPPIYMTSTYIQDDPGIPKAGYDYTRAGNPNFTFLEKQLAALENCAYATVFSSGLGALTALISTLKQGDRVIGIDGVYGGTYRLFDQVFKHFGIQFDSYPYGTPETNDKLEKAMKTPAKWLLFETPTNPLLNVFDIEALVKLARRHDILTLVDNTFASPYLQNPIDWGTDVVWHSSTKYLGGHSDVVGGVVATNSASIKQQLDFARKAVGVNPSPFDCWLVGRGVKTLAVRMERHVQNAMTIARYLTSHSKVKKVYYPGLESHSGYLVAKKQMRGFGGMLSVEFDLSLEKAKKLIASFHLFSLAESLGGVESLVCYPATMTHASIPKEERDRIGLTDGLIRFSVGIEDVQDLLADLDDALILV